MHNAYCLSHWTLCRAILTWPDFRCRGACGFTSLGLVSVAGPFGAFEGVWVRGTGVELVEETEYRPSVDELKAICRMVDWK